MAQFMPPLIYSVVCFVVLKEILLTFQRDEAVKVFEHFVGLGVKPNSATYSLLVDAHLIRRDLKAALSVVTDMVISA